MKLTDKTTFQSLAKNAGGTLLGIFIGLFIGLGVAMIVAIYISKAELPFLDKTAKPALPDKPAVIAKNELNGIEANRTKPPIQSSASTTQNTQPPSNATSSLPEKLRFDFYKILPGGEEQIPEKQLKQIPPVSLAQKEAYFLQIGSYQNMLDADNQKAKLALLGIEAFVQTADIPSKGIWYRVRLGPYANLDEISRMRETLSQSRIEASLIKVKFNAQ